MKPILGCDAHKRYSVFVRLHEDGKTETPLRVEHEREEFRAYLNSLGEAADIAIECTGHWYWLVDEMEKAGHQVHLTQPNVAKKMMGKTNKTDALDAKGLAILLRNGTLPEVWIPPRELRDQRELLRTRMANYGTPPGALLLSATNPENGTVSYTYNGNNKIASKTDAKGQQTQYSYDSYQRLTQVRHYIGGSEDACQQVNFSYDSNPYNGGYSQNASGRLAAVQYKNATTTAGICDTTFQEWYSYNSGGARVGKQMQVAHNGVSVAESLGSSYTYDNEGRMTAQQYPASGPNLTYAWLDRLPGYDPSQEDHFVRSHKKGLALADSLPVLMLVPNPVASPDARLCGWDRLQVRQTSRFSSVK